MRPISATPSQYTDQQVLQYLKVIGFIPAISDDLYDVSTFKPSIQNLRMICHLHVLAFTFENSEMHYSPTHMMDVTAHGVFKRLVQERTGGSYCFGINTLLLEVLRFFGYHIDTGSADYEHYRYMLLDFTSCPHMILFVQIPGSDDGSTYLVDAGFGGAGLLRPILLSEEEGNVVMGTTPTEWHHLKKIDPPNGADDSWTWWRLEVHRAGSYADDRPIPSEPTSWESVMVFSEQPYVAKDYEHASFLLNTITDAARFGWMVCAVKYFSIDPTTLQPLPQEILPRDIDPEKACYDRYTMVGNEVKKTVGIKSELLSMMNTDLERIAMLRDIFKITLKNEDVKYVEGRPAAYGSVYTSKEVERYNKMMAENAAKQKAS